jgi:hypothetical protein
MNFYSLIVFCLVTLSGIQDKHFVDFKANEVRISKDQEHIIVTLPFEILENFHIQSEKTEDNNFIPTEIHFDEPEGYKILEFEFSKTDRENLILGDLKCEVLSNAMEVTLKLKKTTVNKPLYLKGHLYYQACDDRQCFYPRNLRFELKMLK